MKAKIKIKMLADIDRPRVIDGGDWIDLRSAEDTKVGTGVTYIPLGIAVQLPKGYEAIVASRSSTPKNIGVRNDGAIGVIDNAYCGDNDQWMFPARKIGGRAYDSVAIAKNTRIAQFRIQLSQKATAWQKLKWIVTSGVRLEYTDHLGNKDRKGFGSTGTK